MSDSPVWPPEFGGKKLGLGLRLVPESFSLSDDDFGDVVEILGPFKTNGNCKLHTGVILCGDNDLGLGVIVGFDTIIGEGVKIGDGSTIGVGCTIEHNVIIEDNVRIGDGVHLKACVRVERGAKIGTILGGTVIGIAAVIEENADVQGTKSYVENGEVIKVDLVEAGAIVPKDRTPHHQISDSEWTAYAAAQLD
jgi:NDP-sugar pyrophosphorylase family protein